MYHYATINLCVDVALLAMMATVLLATRRKGPSISEIFQIGQRSKEDSLQQQIVQARGFIAAAAAAEVTLASLAPNDSAAACTLLQYRAQAAHAKALLDSLGVSAEHIPKNDPRRASEVTL